MTDSKGAMVKATVQMDHASGVLVMRLVHPAGMTAEVCIPNSINAGDEVDDFMEHLSDMFDSALTSAIEQAETLADAPEENKK